MSTTATDKPKIDPQAFGLKIPNLPRRLRCLECKKTTSGNGNLMLNQKFEIFGADPVATETGDMIDINGLEFYTRQMLLPQSIKYINLQRSSLGLPPVTAETVADVVPEDYVQKEGAAFTKSSLEAKLNEVTGEVILNPLTNKPMTQMKREIGDWCSRD